MIKIKCSFKDSCALDDCPWKYRNLARKWIRWGEYVTIEIDTKTQTAKVLETGDPRWNEIVEDEDEDEEDEEDEDEDEEDEEDEDEEEEE